MSTLSHTIYTISKNVEYKQKVKGSLFLGFSSPISSEDDACEFLNELRKVHHDATHHCYSYKLADNSFKYSDDGEPSGTAGIRIYNAQNHFELTNLITIVVRYFAGTKLGIGPLGKAYYETAIQTLESSYKEEQTLYRQLEIQYDFMHTKLIHHIIDKYEIIHVNNQFEANPKIHCKIPEPMLSKLMVELKEKNISKIKLFVSDTLVYLKKRK